jgi:hypothetical protein
MHPDADPNKTPGPQKELKGRQSQQHQRDRMIPPNKPGDDTQYEEITPANETGDVPKPVIPPQPARAGKSLDPNPAYGSQPPQRQPLPGKAIEGSSSVDRK